MPALLAAGIEAVFAVIFLLISFVGWIINMINAQNPPPAPNRGPQRRPRARDRKVQNEIEQFLQEAMGNKQAARDEVADHEIELAEVAPQRRPPAPRRQPRPTPQPQQQRQRQVVEQPPTERVRPGSGVSGRHLSTSASGAGVASHVKDHMRERVSQETTRHLPHSVDQTVTQHLGDFTADDRDTRHGVAPVFRSHAEIADPTGLISELRERNGIRKAIVLQEILARPRALRK